MAASYLERVRSIASPIPLTKRLPTFHINRSMKHLWRSLVKI
ncbi:hypothetical protein [Floridanema flaviceps]